MKKKSLRLGIAFILLLIGSGLVLMYKGNDAVALAIEKKEGILTAEQVKVAFDSVSGRMVREAVKEAQQVKKGDILMVLDSTDIDLSIGKMKAQIAQLEAQIQSMQGSIRIGYAQTDTNEQQNFRQIDQQRAAVEGANATYENRQLDYNRKAALASSGAISQAELEGHLQNVQQQFSVGMVARADILRSEVALADARQGLVTAANNTKLAEASFNKILGRPIPEPVKLAAGMEYVPENYELENCVEYALAHRPDQVAAQKTVQQAGESIEIASAGKKPNLSFDASYTTYDTKVDEFDTKQWIVGLTASLNVFDGNVTSSQINAAKARRAQAEHQEKDGGAAVEFEVRQAYLNMKKAESNIGTNKVAVEKAREDFSLATARYGANLGTNLDVVDAQVSLTNARTAYIESLYDYNVSRAGLEKAMGKE